MKLAETFFYLGENRRTPKTVIEHLIGFNAEEVTALTQCMKSLPARIGAELGQFGIEIDPAWTSGSYQQQAPLQAFAQVFTATALKLQNVAGHQVGYCTQVPEGDTNQCRLIYEYEEIEVGKRAGALTLLLMKKCVPSLEWSPKDDNDSGDIAHLMPEFLDFAARKALPLDTSMIIKAAVSADIPFLKLSRFPFEEVGDEQLIRANSNLQLGHACHQHIIDGTFCVDRSYECIPLIKDRDRLIETLDSFGLTIPPRDRQFQNCTTGSRARRSAARVGYPVVVKPASKSSAGVSTGLYDESALQQALEKAQRHSRKVIIEKHVVGDTFKLVLANGHLLGVVRVNSSPEETAEITGRVDKSIALEAEAFAQSLDVGLLVLTMVTTDITLPLLMTKGAFVDLDVAPELDSFLPQRSTLYQSAVQQFVNWLYPSGSPSRIPLIAITGTNGKTTTSRMIHAILNLSGFSTGLACTEGVYTPQEGLIQPGDLSGFAGHLLLLRQRQIDSAVLEAARGSVLKSGFGFDRCSVSVCLNVTSDHLGEGGISSLEQMAALKRSIVERADGAIVLNADDPRCVSMLPFPDYVRLCLASLDRSYDELSRLHPECSCFSLVEDSGDENWIVIYDSGTRNPILPVREIPATFGGAARYNLANALHASAACYLQGVKVDQLRRGLSRFHMNFENTPGRLNFYDRMPFRVLLDYAHNPDGLSHLCKFTDTLEVSGRKLVAFSAAAYNPPDVIRGNALAVAGHFDKYFCYNFPGNIKEQADQIPFILEETLMEQGLPSSDISVAVTCLEATRAMLQQAKAGDLVVILSGHSDRADIWNYVTTYEKEPG